MKLSGYGYSDFDEIGYRYQVNGRHFCTVSHVSPNPCMFYTDIRGLGESWIGYHDCLKSIRSIRERSKTGTAMN